MYMVSVQKRIPCTVPASSKMIDITEMKRNRAEEAKLVCHDIWHIYLEERDYETMFTYIDPMITIIGTGAHEISCNMQECLEKMKQEAEQWDGSFTITKEWYQVNACDESTYIVIGELHTKENGHNRIIYDVTTRFTMVLQVQQEEWKILHAHQSIADYNQKDDEFFPKRIIEQSNRMLEERIAEKTRELEESNQQVLYYSRFDYLTDIWNRHYCEKQIEKTMRIVSHGIMLMIDVDNFKWYNDTYGHPFGDSVLKTLAYCMKSVFGQGLVGRIGGDEFIVYGTECENDPACVEERIQEFFAFWTNAQKALDIPEIITLSIGVAQYPQHGDDFDAVWRNADKAMYAAKKHNNNTICFYDDK